MYKHKNYKTTEKQKTEETNQILGPRRTLVFKYYNDMWVWNHMTPINNINKQNTYAIYKNVELFLQI